MYRSIIDKDGHSRSRVVGGAGAVALAALVSALLVVCAPAMALVKQGHVHAFEFGGQGPGEGQLLNPAGVAVNESTGDVYVVDRGNNRIEQFDSGGNFVAAWGFGVKDGAREYEVCKRGEACKAGLPGTGKGKEKFHLGPGQLISPEAIAVDNSTTDKSVDPSAGDVYVVADVVAEKSFVDKFGPEGEYLGHLTKKEETESYGRADGVGVDAQGKVWVAWRGEGAVTRFNDAEKNKRLGEEPYLPEDNVEMRPGFAVDANDNLYLNFEPAQKFLLPFESTEYEETQFSEEGRGEHGEEPCEAALPCFLAKITTAEEGERPVEPGEAFIEGLFGETTTAVAVEPATNDVYVDHGGAVAAFTSGGTLIQRFGEGYLQKGSGVAGNAKTGQVYVADAAAGDVQVFKREGPGQPTVDGLSVAKVTTGGAELGAQINPTGQETTVSFQYGTASCAEGSCASVSVAPLTVEGEAPTAYEDQARSLAVSGLVPGATYHFRVVVAHGSVAVDSAEQTFTTPPLALADSRAWEMVSSPAKNGGIESLSRDGGVIQASEDGSAITYITTGPSESNPEGNRSPAFTQNLATRGGSSEGKPQWSSKEIAIQNPERAPGVAPGKEQEYQYFSPDLKLALLEPFGRFPQAEPKLSPQATEKTLYVRHNEGCAPPPSACYVPLVTAESDTAGTNFGGKSGEPNTGVRFLDATPSLDDVALSSEVPLTTEPAAAEGNLYEWSRLNQSGEQAKPGEQLHLVNVLPGGTPAPNPGLGDWFRDFRHAISSNGSRVVWSTKEGVNSFPLHLYTRDMAAGETIQVDVPEGGTTLGKAEAPVFQTASSDGTKVFFTDEQRLTTSSHSTDEQTKPDLYVYDVNSRKLTDLTPGSASETADVRGLALGASEDGSTVYFVANGVLSTGENAQHETATPGHCGEQEQLVVPGATCNLYVERLNGETWEAPQFIARLSNLDLPDWGRTGRDDLGEVSARVSPEGRFLAFMSQRPLIPGYDNRAANPAAGGARAEEVYLYELSSGKLTCASCNPTGARPNAVFDQEQSGEGLGLVVDRSEQWENHWLAGSIPGWTHSEGQQALYQSRYLSDTGRLFFNSADSLVPADENGKEDVYEYERAGEGTCSAASGCVSLISSGTSAQESAFLDASVSGNDVFFLTAATLVPADKENFDVYDARVCSAGSPCVAAGEASTPPCESSATCKSATTSAPVFAPPASSLVSGSGNIASPKGQVLPSKATKPAAKPTRAQQLAKALKACRKLKRKSKRVACEKSARKRYGPKKSTKKTVKKGHK